MLWVNSTRRIYLNFSKEFKFHWMGSCFAFFLATGSREDMNPLDGADSYLIRRIMTAKLNNPGNAPLWCERLPTKIGATAQKASLCWFAFQNKTKQNKKQARNETDRFELVLGDYLSLKVVVCLNNYLQHGMIRHQCFQMVELYKDVFSYPSERIDTNVV